MGKVITAERVDEMFERFMDILDRDGAEAAKDYVGGSTMTEEAYEIFAGRLAALMQASGETR